MRGTRPIVLGFAWLTILSLGLARAGDELSDETFRNWNYCNTMANIALNRGDYIAAESRFNAAIKTIKDESKKDARFLARSYTGLALVLYYQKRYDEAEPLAAWALSVREKVAEDSPMYLFQSTYVLALIRAAERRFADAEVLFKKALALQEAALGTDNSAVTPTYDNLAGVYREQRKYAEAEPLYKQAIAILERTRPSENTDLADTSLHYAALLRRVNRDQEAEGLEARAKAIRETVAANAAAKAARDKAARAADRFQAPRP